MYRVKDSDYQLCEAPDWKRKNREQTMSARTTRNQERQIKSGRSRVANGGANRERQTESDRSDQERTATPSYSHVFLLPLHSRRSLTLQLSTRLSSSLFSPSFCLCPPRLCPLCTCNLSCLAFLLFPVYLVLEASL